MSNPLTWKVSFYRSERGESPVEEFLDRLPMKARAKCLAYIEQLEQHGYALPSNYIKKIAPDLWELCPEFGGTEYRFFYFSFVDRQLVIVHAITKKGQKLGPSDIELAQTRVADVRVRQAGERMMLNFKTNQQYIAEQSENDAEFVAELEQARLETEFAVALAMLREQRGLTQQQVAAAAGIGQPMLARYEKGNQLPSLPTLQRLAHALDARVTLSSHAIAIAPAPRSRAACRPPKGNGVVVGQRLAKV